jgi:preprotein translocase subunit SecA
MSEENKKGGVVIGGFEYDLYKTVEEMIKTKDTLNNMRDVLDQQRSEILKFEKIKNEVKEIEHEKIYSAVWDVAYSFFDKRFHELIKERDSEISKLNEKVKELELRPPRVVVWRRGWLQ